MAAGATIANAEPGDGKILNEWIPLPDSVDIGGWLSAGHTTGSTGMFNNIDHRLNTNQAWLYLEKEADGSSGFDWGFRVDIMYGIDSADTQSFGNDPGRFDFINGWDRGANYGWALPQLYVELASGDWSVKAGHFYTILGYETVPAPDNFFYSHALTMYNSEPFTHTGVLAEYQATDNLTLYGGWTLGWDTGFDQWGKGSSFLGGVSWDINDDMSLAYMVTAGDFGLRGDGYSHSIVFDWQVTEQFNYVLQSDLVHANVGFGGGYNNEVGINQYFIYDINEQWSVGARFEWWKSDAGFNHGGQSLPLGGSASYYSATIGVNYKPCEYLTIRPEYRYDWFPASGGLAFGAPGGYEQGIFAIDAVITF